MDDGYRYPEYGSIRYVTVTNHVSVQKFGYVDGRADEPSWYQISVLYPNLQGICMACPCKSSQIGCFYDVQPCIGDSSILPPSKKRERILQ